MASNQALVKRTASNGNGLAVSTAQPPKQTAQVLTLTEELVDEILKGRDFRGWLRGAKGARILGLFSLYLFLDTYDVRADFNRRAVTRLRDLARDKGRRARLKAWFNEQLYTAFDRFIRVLRYLVFRGVEGSARKQARLQKQAVWMRESLIGLGPTFIKIGQALGTRADLLPLEYVRELATLQDQVPAFSTAEAFAIIESELGRSVHESYAEIDKETIAAASLGQVYRARLHSGQEVAVKVQRPNLEATIKGDIVILKKVANFAERFPQLNENADWSGMLREFDTTIHEEMDYVAEGRNAEQFRDNFKNWSNIHVRSIYCDSSTE